MPAQCGDPVSDALHSSLSAVKKTTRPDDHLDSTLVCSAKQILLSNIQYEPASPLSTTPLTDLKSRYMVLSEEEATEPGPSKPSPPKKPTMDQDVSLPRPKQILFPLEMVKLGWKDKYPVGSGFVNMGNTCYLNSTLQALFHVPAFVNWILNDTSHSSMCKMLNGMTHSECIICAVAKTLQNSLKCTGSAIKPLSIYCKLRSICKHLTHGHQEDAHEFLRYLIEGMERSYLTIFNGQKLDTISKETTPLNQIFGGYLRSEVKCLECSHVSTTFQHFQDLLLDIRQVSSVDQALDAYFSREQLGDGERAYKCEQCNKKVAATKKFSIERAPKALCVQLKRFNATGSKNSKHIALKDHLDLSKFRAEGSKSGDSSSPLRYKLVSMVTHLGPSACCGHYTAVGRAANGNYYLFDDSVVRHIPQVGVLHTNAYILMYEQHLGPDPKKTTSNSNGVTPANGVEAKPSTNGDTSTHKPATPSNLKRAREDEPSLETYGPSIPRAKLETSESAETTPARRPSSSSSSESDGSRPSSAPTTPSASASAPAPAPSLSLVPYLSESESETESVQSNSQTKASTGNTTWEITAKDPSPPAPSKPTSPTPVAPGWRVTSMDRDKRKSPSPSRPRPAVVSFKIGLSRTSTPASTSFSSSSASSASSSSSSSSGSKASSDPSREPSRSLDREPHASTEPRHSWDMKRNSSTTQELLKMSHRGYGNSVSSWNGERSEIDRQVDKDRQSSSKRYPSYDDCFDRGKVKKVKKYHLNSSSNGRSDRNPFHEVQNRKNYSGYNSWKFSWQNRSSHDDGDRPRSYGSFYNRPRY